MHEIVNRRDPQRGAARSLPCATWRAWIAYAGTLLLQWPAAVGFVLDSLCHDYDLSCAKETSDVAICQVMAKAHLLDWPQRLG